MTPGPCTISTSKAVVCEGCMVLSLDVADDNVNVGKGPGRLGIWQLLPSETQRVT